MEEERKERLKRERLWKERIVRGKVDVTITVFFLSRTFSESGFVPKILHVLTQLIPRAAPQGGHIPDGQEHRHDWFIISALRSTDCMILGKFLDVSLPQFPHLCAGDDESSHSTGL